MNLNQVSEGVIASKMDHYSAAVSVVAAGIGLVGAGPGVAELARVE